MSQSTVSAATVRAFFSAEPKRLARLSEAGQTNVAATRGRLSAEVVETYNKGRRSRLYVPGEASKATAEARVAAQAKRQALRDAGVPVKDRGRLPKA